jgi:HEAT repeat protein
MTAHAMTAHAMTAHAMTAVVAQATIARDPADSLYKAARDALAQGDYARAAQLFHDVGARYPQSAFAPDALYYEAFARYHSGETDDLQAARALLDTLRAKYPSYRGRGEAGALATRVCGALAQQGDATCAARISAEAHASATGSASSSAQSDCNNEDDDRAAALNALLQMDADRAMPILEKVLARRDACSASLRRKAVFLVSQKQTPQTVDVLLRVARTDPDPEVRGQAVFWLSQVPGDRTVDVLSEILHGSSDPSIRDKAIFALSQNHSQRASELLRQYATDASAPKDLRAKAIFWIGQHDDAASRQFLESLYEKLTDVDLKDKALFALSQQHEGDHGAWLLDIARRPSEPIEMRKKALFYAGQGGATTAQIASFYDALPPGEMREQAVFVLSQRNDDAAINKLISIARSDKDPDARKRAIFWLGQSQNPRAVQFLQELIEK